MLISWSSTRSPYRQFVFPSFIYYPVKFLQIVCFILSKLNGLLLPLILSDDDLQFHIHQAMHLREHCETNS